MIAVAVQPSRAAVEEWDDVYCGLYSVYAGARVAGVDVHFEELLDARFISRRDGSTASDLLAAIDHLGLSARLHQGMTRFDLVQPSILHVRAESRSPQPDHWLLFLRREGGTAVLIDGRAGVVREPWPRLLARWDGAAIVLGSGDDPPPRWLPSHVGALLLVLGVVGGAALAGRRQARSSPTSGRRLLISLAGGGAVLGIASACGLAIAAGDPASILRQHEMRQAVVDRNIGKFLPTVAGREQVRAMLQSPGVVVIDSRYPSDFALGHLPGARNIPVNSSPSSAAAALEGVPHDARLLLYCQSPGCDFAERLAGTLRQAGYRNMTIYTGGYNNWRGRS